MRTRARLLLLLDEGLELVVGGRLERLVPVEADGASGGTRAYHCA